MWLERFWKLIDSSAVGRGIDKRRKLLEYNGEPGRIYVENVRAFLGIPHATAKWLCELAVRQGLFERCSALTCPNGGNILFETCDGETAPSEEINCEACEGQAIEPHVFRPDDCIPMLFYRVPDEQYLLMRRAGAGDRRGEISEGAGGGGETVSMV